MDALRQRHFGIEDRVPSSHRVDEADEEEVPSTTKAKEAIVSPRRRRCSAAADNGVAPTAWVAHFPTMPSMTLSAIPTTISRRSSTVARPKTTAMIPKSATLTARYGAGRWIGRGTSRRAPSAEAVKKIARNI